MVRKCYGLLIPFFLIVFSIVTNVYAVEQKIYDAADLFTDTEEEQMQEEVALLSEQLEIDIVIVTTDDNQGKTSKEYADDFYDEHGFGYGDSVDGILYLINMDDREVYISTAGRIIDLFEPEIEAMLDAVYPYLADAYFSDSVYVFLEEVQSIMEASYDHDSNDGSIIEETDEELTIEENNEGITLKEILIYFAISLVVGGGTVGIMAMYNRGRSTVDEGTYLEKETFKITRKLDKHYNTIVTQQKIQNSSSSSSSSGSSHGGGGRSF